MFIIGALLKLGSELNTPFTNVTVCLTDVANCAKGIYDGEGGVGSEAVSQALWSQALDSHH